MFVAITEDISHQVYNQLSVISDLDSDLQKFFEDKEYGVDLLVLYIRVRCMSPNFEKLSKPRRPKYITQGRVYTHHGTQTISQSMTLSYELKLDFEIYLNARNIMPLFVTDVLNSLEVIKTIKKIKDFDYEAFRRDFETFFWQVGWLS